MISHAPAALVMFAFRVNPQPRLTKSPQKATLLTRQSVTMLLPKIGYLINAVLNVKRERRKEARPDELLDAALDLFVKKGFAASRAEEVAARAGQSRGTLFYIFKARKICSRRWFGKTFQATLKSGTKPLKTLKAPALKWSACACTSGGGGWARPKHRAVKS